MGWSRQRGSGAVFWSNQSPNLRVLGSGCVDFKFHGHHISDDAADCNIIRSREDAIQHKNPVWMFISSLLLCPRCLVLHNLQKHHKCCCTQVLCARMVSPAIPDALARSQETRGAHHRVHRQRVFHSESDSFEFFELLPSLRFDAQVYRCSDLL